MQSLRALPLALLLAASLVSVPAHAADNSLLPTAAGNETFCNKEIGPAKYPCSIPYGTDGLPWFTSSKPGQVTGANGTFPSTQSGTWSINQGGTWTVQPGNTPNTTPWLVSLSGSNALPTGAATAAKQPALGTAGSAAADVLTVQGIASMTPFLVAQNGTWNITNISGTISLPTGAATSANQSSQITQETAVNTALGTTASAAATVGSTGDVNAKLRLMTTQIDDLKTLVSAMSTKVDATNTKLDTANTNITSAVPAGSAIIGKFGIDQTTPGTTNGVQVVAALPAGTSLLGKFGIDQTTPGTTNGVQLPAAETHLGEIGSNQIKVDVAQTVTASSAYSAGNAIGGKMTIAGAARVSGSLGAGGTSGILQQVVVNSKSLQTGQVDVFIFNSDPSASTCTDKTAFVLATADFDKVVGVASVPSTAANGSGWFGGGTGSVGQAMNLAMAYDLASATSLYACAVARGTPTFAATSDINVKFQILRN